MMKEMSYDELKTLIKEDDKIKEFVNKKAKKIFNKRGYIICSKAQLVELLDLYYQKENDELSESFVKNAERPQQTKDEATREIIKKSTKKWYHFFGIWK